MAASGSSRLVHAFTYYYWPRFTAASMAVSDAITAIVCIFGALLIPWATWEIRKVPSPREIEHAIRGNMQKHRMEAEAQRAQQEKRRVERQRNILAAVLNNAPLSDE